MSSKLNERGSGLVTLWELHSIFHSSDFSQGPSSFLVDERVRSPTLFFCNSLEEFGFDRGEHTDWGHDRLRLFLKTRNY